MSETLTNAALLEELRWRGLLHQCTDEAGIIAHLDEEPRRVYAGFDPTADSLTIGNLVPLMLLRHFQQAGHKPVIIAGGGTGLIGDPSGKTAERQLLTADDVEANVRCQQQIYENVLEFDGPHAATIVNNAEWLTKIGFLEALRDIGKHFSINMMIQKESVKERLQNREQGISYTEFSYMILQAYDFFRLFEDRQVTVQVGGSDQWGNIVAGIDLTRRCAGAEVFGLTAPLVTKSDGGKFGKTETGAVWLTAGRTSPYAYYQFWLNSDDADVDRYLKIFTLLPQDRIEKLLAAHAAAPHERHAHRALAQEATRLVHGETGVEAAEAATAALFSGDVSSLDAPTLDDVFSAAPQSSHAATELSDGLPLVDLLPQTSLASSKREAREFLGAGAVSINGAKAAPDATVSSTDLLHGSTILLRRGKKNWHVTRWQ